ncbi:MAG: hypothetical protein QXH03_07855 [Candidatus Bathyarchaeia archaeon]
MTDPAEILLEIAPPKSDKHLQLQTLILKSIVREQEPRKTPITLAIARAIRQLTDKLTAEELAFLVWTSFPEELEKLSIEIPPKEKHEQIAKKLRQKGILINLKELFP